MKRIVNGWAVLVVGITLLASCFDPPVFSPIPAIELDRVVFKDVTDPSTPDSLILSVKFTDGD
ncbi:MAG: hypothetical protein K2U26_06255, partial [Cyclobacteriaceae bacterium]|nr:hypothetical protein [Cyclobacteriaceae bacterium]